MFFPVPHSYRCMEAEVHAHVKGSIERCAIHVPLYVDFRMMCKMRNLAEDTLFIYLYYLKRICKINERLVLLVSDTRHLFIKLQSIAVGHTGVSTQPRHISFYSWTR